MNSVTTHGSRIQSRLLFWTHEAIQIRQELLVFITDHDEDEQNKLTCCFPLRSAQSSLHTNTQRS